MRGRAARAVVTPLEGMRAGAAIVLLAYLPGRVWTAVLLPGLRSRIERFVSSVVISVVMLVLALVVGSLAAGLRVGAATAVGWSLALSFLGAGVLLAPRLHRRLVVVK